MSTSHKFSASQKVLVRRSLGEVGFAPIFIVILVTALALGSGYLIYINYSNNQTKITQPQPTTQSKPKPSPSPSDVTHESTTSAASPAPNGAVETANWEAFANKKYGYSFKYPPDISVEEDQYGVWINKQILISVDSKRSEGPCGDCPNYNGPAEDINIANIQTKKLSGEIGSVGGNIPQKFQEVQFENDNLYYTITLYALEYDTEPPLYDGYYEIPENDKRLFDQILSTFKFIK